MVASMVARKGGPPSCSSSAPSTSSNATSGSSSDAGDSDADIVCSWSPPSNAGRHPKTKQQKSMFKQCSGNEWPRPAAAASCQADGLAERLGTLMLLGKGKAAVTGKVKRFALEKGRPNLLRRAKRRPPALSWDQVEQTLDEGGQRHSGLIEDADVEGRPPVDEHVRPCDCQWCGCLTVSPQRTSVGVTLLQHGMPSAPREAFGATREHVEMPAAPHSMIASGSSAPRRMPVDEYEKPAAPRRMST